MSPNVGNFVHDLVEMAKAMETLPMVQAELAKWQSLAAKRTDHIMQLEQNIITYKDEIERLHALVRDAEGRADKAETMFLEADDRTVAALSFIKTQFGAAGALIQALEPPKPESVVVAPVVPAPVAVESSEPVSGVSVQTDSLVAAETSASSVQSMEATSLPSGQSELLSTAPSMDNSPASTAEPITTESAITSTPTKPLDNGPYFGKLYMHTPGLISRTDWLMGGGTKAAYDWRPGDTLPDDITVAE